MSVRLPNSAPARVTVSKRPLDARLAAELDAIALLLPADGIPALPAALPHPERWLERKHAAVSERTVAATVLDNRRATRIVALRCPANDTPMAIADVARRLAVSALGGRPERVGVVVAGFDDHTAGGLTQWLLEAFLINDFRLPNFAESDTSTSTLKQIRLFSPVSGAERLVSVTRAAANNLARWLGAMPPNLLDATAMRSIATQLGRELGLKAQFYSINQLRKMGAGAFAAVAQGNADDDAGILRLSYTPSAARSRRLVAIAGKGILFDTGGNNLKPFRGMLDMHLDMQGSAVALAATRALAQLRFPHRIDCWLALTENRIGPAAYKSQDLLRSLSGKTIQTIHTDAEGRLALADTLTLAARRNPDLIIDFATLTGSCVNAVTTRYSGIFSNFPALFPLLKDIGAAAAERVWPFPIEDDFRRDIRSDVADLLQCRVDGNGDHIYAAAFLSEFVPAAIPWVHVDLAAAQHKGGLGLVGTEITGFGARLGIDLALAVERLLSAVADD